MMDVIYRAARSLIIALEDVQLDETEEEVGTKYHEMYLKPCARNSKKQQPTDSERLKMIAELFVHNASDPRASNQFILKMLNARWHSRAWCAHERKVNPHGKVNNPLFSVSAAMAASCHSSFDLCAFCRSICEPNTPNIIHGRV